MRLFLMFFLFPILVSSQIDSLRLAHAEQSYSSQEYAKAYHQFDQFIQEDSTFYFAYERAGVSAYRLGDFKSAKRIFLKLSKKDSTNVTALKQLASLYEIEENTPKTIKYYLALSQSDESNSIYQRKLGQQFLKANLPMEAFPYFVKTNKINPKDNYAITGLADIWLKNKQYKSADSLLSKSLAYDAENVIHNLMLARSKYSQKQYDSTTVVLERAKRKIDLSNYYSKMLGYSYMQIDSLEKAINYLEISLVDETNPENAHYYLATAYEKKGDQKTAIHHYQKAIEAGISGNVDIYHRNLARIYDREQNLKAAIPHYEDAYKYGKNPVLLFYLARSYDVYFADKSMAIRQYKKYENSKDDHPEYKNYAKERRKYLQEQRHQSQGN